MFKFILVSLIVISSLTVANATAKRSHAARDHFVKANACPATGLNKLPCHGYVIDHIIPLCAGGPDQPSNMQWQDLKASYLKDVQERKECRAIKKS